MIPATFRAPGVPARSFEVVEILRRWRSPSAVFLQVVTADARKCVLRFDSARMRWEPVLLPVRDGDGAPAALTS
ncbi:MAG TPA: hypothetical protein VMV18_01170 [bacterium]|nr:hypothetical protein [bacterium]